MRITVVRMHVQFNPESWADFIDTAGVAIAYWAAPPAIVDEEARTYTVRVWGTLDDPAEPGDDSDGITEVVITEKMLADAIEEVVSIQTRRFRAFYEEDYDAEDVDVVIQQAVFGKIIYG